MEIFKHRDIDCQTANRLLFLEDLWSNEQSSAETENQTLAQRKTNDVLNAAIAPRNKSLFNRQVLPNVDAKTRESEFDSARELALKARKIDNAFVDEIVEPINRGRPGKKPGLFGWVWKI